MSYISAVLLEGKKSDLFNIERLRKRSGPFCVMSELKKYLTLEHANARVGSCSIPLMFQITERGAIYRRVVCPQEGHFTLMGNCTQG